MAMSDGGGMSGIDLSELGLATKKAGQQVARVANPFLQGVTSQLTGKTTPPASSQEATRKPKTPSGATAPSETPTSGTFDIASLAKSLKQQITGVNTQQPLGQGQSQPKSGTFQMPHTATTSKPPSEAVQDPFKMGDVFAQKDSFAPIKTDVASSGIAAKQQQNEEVRVKNEQEANQKIESLRKKLHDIQTEKILKAGETKEDQTDNEKKKKEEQEKEEQKKKEEQEDKMQPVEMTGKKKKGSGFQKLKTSMSNILNSMLKRRKGSHEGAGGKG